MVKDRWNSVRNGDDNAAYVAEYAGPWYDYMNRGLEGGFGALDLAATAGGASTLAGLAGWPAALRVGAGVGTLRPAFVMEGAYEVGKAARDAIVADTKAREAGYNELNQNEAIGRQVRSTASKEFNRHQTQGQIAEAKPYQDVMDFTQGQQETNAKLHWASPPEYQVNHGTYGKRITRRPEPLKPPYWWEWTFGNAGKYAIDRHLDFLNGPRLVVRDPDTGEERSVLTPKEAARQLPPHRPGERPSTLMNFEGKRVDSTPVEHFLPPLLSAAVAPESAVQSLSEGMEDRWVENKDIANGYLEPRNDAKSKPSFWEKMVIWFNNDRAMRRGYGGMPD